MRGMSDLSVDVVRRIYEAWDREESARAFIAADLEYVNPSYAIEPGTRRGAKSLGLVRASYEDWKVQVERIVDAGEDNVVVLAHFTATGRTSGVPVAGEQGYVWTVKDGLAVRFRWFRSHREALEAAGVQE
jgi:ketosteroid isomerase-like protein